MPFSGPVILGAVLAALLWHAGAAVAARHVKHGSVIVAHKLHLAKKK